MRQPGEQRKGKERILSQYFKTGTSISKQILHCIPAFEGAVSTEGHHPLANINQFNSSQLHLNFYLFIFLQKLPAQLLRVVGSYWTNSNVCFALEYCRENSLLSK